MNDCILFWLWNWLPHRLLKAYILLLLVWCSQEWCNLCEILKIHPLNVHETSLHFKVNMWHKLFFIEEGLSKWWRVHLFCWSGILGCQDIQGFDLCKLDKLLCDDVDTKSCKITKKYGIPVQILSLQGWNFAGLMYCKNYTLW